MASDYTTWKIDDEVKIRMASEGEGAKPAKTVIQALQETRAKLGAANALHVKRNGEWETLTFDQYYAKITAFAKSLLAVGLERHDGVSIIGFNSPEWAIADLGAIFAGGVAAGIYTTNNPPACEYIAKHSDSTVVVCDGVMQLEKFVAIEKNLPKLKALVIWNEPVPEGLQTNVPVYAFEDFINLGKDVPDAQLAERMDVQKPGHCCTLIYTSGTTGDPKAVMISHDNFIWTIRSVMGMIERSFGVAMSNNDRLVSFLPMSHVASQLIDIMLPVVGGLQCYFAQPDALKGSLGVTLKEVRPTFFLGVPRVWEKIAEKMWAISAETTGIKKRIASWAKDKAAQKTALAQYGKSGGAPCGFGVANSLVLSRVKEALGLDQCVSCFSGAAPIHREVVEYFGSLDLPIFEFFGQSEGTGPQTVCMQGSWKIGTCGRPIDGTEMKVLPDTEELVFAGRNNMMGYLKNEEQTKAVIDEEGYLHTGDCGKIDEDGFMMITGRIKELIITAGGENVPPILIEDALKEELPILSNAMVIGDKRKFLTVLLTLRVNVDGEGVPTDKLDAKALSICREIGSTATTVSEAKACAKVKEYLDKGLKRANSRATSRAQNLGKYEVLDTDFSIHGGELTPTLKLKRKVVLEKYGAIIDAMYA
uniref:AMP-dependent synthetase/ligase domain-containing protein n=1 Tax=Globisporangium ultimum (strain ATCC 200006 / CBS 805.95 / DAOM BR144) TaxID=431595 RepID=K3W526_GLOUD